MLTHTLGDNIEEEGRVLHELCTDQLIHLIGSQQRLQIISQLLVNSLGPLAG